MTTSYSASRIKQKPVRNTKKTKRKKPRTRRTGEELAELDRAMMEFIQEHRPVSVRQVFYHLASIRMIPKDKNQYDSIQKRLSKMRKDKKLPYDWIADGTRWLRKPRTFNSTSEALEYSIRNYRRAIWTEQRIHIEFWLEKEALASTISDILDEWDIPFYVSRGFSSHSYLHSASQYLMAIEKESHVYVMTDCDKDGLKIQDSIQKGIAEHCASHPYDIHIHRLALTPEQVMGWRLQTRDAKPGKGVLPGNQDADLDAIPPTQFRWLVEDAIASHIDDDRYQRLMAQEKLERETLDWFLDAWNKATGDEDQEDTE